MTELCQDLRDILMHRSAIPVWRAARDNIDGLPGLPDDLSEPQYAHLAFYIHCHVSLEISKT